MLWYDIIWPLKNYNAYHFLIDDSSPCIEGSIRLADGSTNKNGRVEVCYNGVWGSICGSGWSLPDAIVVCNQLRLTNGSK